MAMKIDQSGEDYGVTDAALDTLRDELAARFGRVAIVHEWLTIPGGSEKVVCALLDLLPQAELFTSVYDPEPWPRLMTDRPIHRSALDRLPGAVRYHRHLLPLLDSAFRSFDLSAFDLVISSNHACAKNVRTPAMTPHICYCHTPMRYAWDPSYLEGEALGPVVRRLVPAATAWLRRVDRRRGANPDVYVANSTYVSERIMQAYGRPSIVIHPPVDVEGLLDVPRDPGDAYLVFGRLVPYKRADLAVQACRRLGRKLIVAGAGRDLPRLRRIAGPDTEFLGQVADEDLPRLFSRARALLFPGVEDFGIVPVEAQAAGLPVIAHGRGGVRDTVRDGVTGVLYEDNSVDGLCRAIERFESLSLDGAQIRENARGFAPERFGREIASLLLSIKAGAQPADTLFIP